MVKPVCVKPQEPSCSITTLGQPPVGTVGAVRTIAQLGQACCNVVGFLSTLDLRAYLSTSREEKSSKSEAVQANTDILIEVMNAEILQLGYSEVSNRVLNDIAQHVLGADYSQKTAAQKTELFHKVLSHWGGVPSTQESVGQEARRLCDRLFPPDLDKSGLPIYELDTLPASRQPRVRAYTSFPPFSDPVEVQTQVSIQQAVAAAVHVLFV